MRDLRSIARRIAKEVGITLLAILAAAVARKFLLQALETRIVWVTFYPAVTVAAFYGGWTVGLLTSTTSCLVAVYAWPLFTSVPFIKDQADWIGLVAFLINCGFISAVAEAARRARFRALRAQGEAEAANRAKSVFLANMSHELRTPLNAILGFSQIMSADPATPAEQRKTLGIINRSGEHLLRMINDVLDMAKIEAGGLRATLDVVDLHGLTHEVTELMRQRAESKGLLLVLDQPAGLPRFIRTDASKLRQILLNLLGNAIKFTSHGSVALQLRAEVAGTGTQGVLALAVRDTGPGIALEDQQRLFQPFVQLGQAGDQKGTGLGLAITRQFVELLGGRVFVESEPGKGATFRVELPFEVAQALEPADAVPNLGGLARLEPGQTQYRILIVEDQPENWLLLRRLLEHAGFLVKVSENGAAGVEDFRSWRPHLIWMDWRMPVMDGLEATRRIRALDGGREVKIAVLSASVLEQERQQVMAAGADDFVAKPFVFQQIYSCMARHLGVRFAPEEADYTQPRVASPDANLESLVDLPPEYRRRLLDALVALDQKKIAAAIETIAACNPGLGFALRHHAERLQYTCMLRALQPNLAQTLSQNSQA